MTRLPKNIAALILSLLIWAPPSSLMAEPVAEPEKVAPLAADLVTDGQPIDLDSERYRVLFGELHSKHGFRKDDLEKTFAGVTIQKRVLELMDKQWESRPWYDYYPRLITTRNILEGRKQLRRYQGLLDKIEKELGVEREIVVAIWGIESRFGQNKGDFNLFRTLNTMFDAYPRRSAFYRNQLIDFLLLCRENNLDPRAVTGSYGGAFGQTQFIPSSFQEYAVDFDHDGRRDVWSSVPDVLASIANYLHHYGWKYGSPIYVEIGTELRDAKLVETFNKGRKGLVNWQEVANSQKVTLSPPPGGKELTIVGLEQREGGMLYLAGYPNLQAITKWNNSNRYAVAVAQLAALFKE